MPILRIGWRLLPTPAFFSARKLHCTSPTLVPRRFIPSQLDRIENTEDYRLGGCHPISIGDCFDKGRYRVIHKLGFGGSSTVWLARDQQAGKLVTLKAIRADASSKRPEETPALVISQVLRDTLPSLAGIQTIEQHFFVQGPNGSHLFLVSPLAGPSVLAMSDSPGRTVGSRRLRADLARKVAQQIAITVHHLHRANIAHGDLTTSNILFSLSPHIHHWSAAELYANVGEPQTEEVRTCDGTPRPPCAPAELVAPIGSELAHWSHLQENVILADFGQAYAITSPPSANELPATVNYCAPETQFERRVGLEADVWALGCAIFTIRSGFELFDVWFGNEVDLLEQTMEILGPLPDHWWSAFKQRASWFDENGRPKSVQDQERVDILLASKGSIREQLRSIGTQDERAFTDEGRMIEKHGVRLSEEEVELLGDLLEKMLKYRPEERIKMCEVINHPWFALQG
ncbi:kinase-like protein [Peniophora sp. CONT]|nr:kinase-like protein [Peniophora sp. CONT]